MYETKNSLQVIIEDLDLALKRGCLFAALSLALIIPDICGKAKDPNAGVGKRYIEWFDQYIGNHMRKVFAGDGEKLPYLSGKLVYGLRWAFLHSGSANVESHDEHNYEDFRLDDFALQTSYRSGPFADVSSMDEITGKTSYIVDIRELCNLLKWSAEAFLRKEQQEVIDRLEKLKIFNMDKEVLEN